MAVFKVRTCKILAALLLGCCTLCFPRVSGYGWNFQKERQEGEGKRCMLLWWKVLEPELIMVWLTSTSYRFEFRMKAWLALREKADAESAEGILRSHSNFKVLFP